MVQEIRDLLQGERMERRDEGTLVADAPRRRGSRCLVGVKREATTVVCHGHEGIVYRTNAYGICLAQQFSPTHDATG